MIRRSFVFNLLIALLVGGFITLLVMQNDDRFKQKCQVALVNLFEQAFDCHVLSAHINKLNIFSGSIIIDSVSVVAQDSVSWRWQAHEVKIKTSWLYLIFKKKIGLEITLNEIFASSLVEKQHPKIVDHVLRMIDGPPGMPIDLRSFKIAQSTLRLNNSESFNAQLTFNAQLSNGPEQIKLVCYIDEGMCSDNCFGAIENVQATCIVEKYAGKKIPHITCSVQGQCLQLPSAAQQILAQVRINDKESTIVIGSKSHGELIKARGLIRDLNNMQIEVAGEMPLELLTRFCGQYIDTDAIQGIAQGKMEIKAVPGKEIELNGSVQLRDLNYRAMRLGSFTLDVQRMNCVWQGNVQMDAAFGGLWKGTYHFDEKKQQGTGTLFLDQPHQLGTTAFYVQSHETMINCSYDNQSGMNGSYAFKMMHDKNESSYQTHGNFQSDGKKIQLDGVYNNDTYQIVTLIDNEGIVCTGSYVDEKNKTLGTIERAADGAITSTIDYSVLRLLFEQLFNIRVKGQGSITLHGYYHDSRFDGSLAMNNGTIQLVPTYNFINDFKTEMCLDFSARKVTFQNAFMKLHEGSMKCARAVCMLDKDGAVSFVHMPLVMEKMFLNFEKDCFMVVSGATIFSKTNDHAAITGRIIVDKSQLKKNLFSLVTSKQFVAPFKIPFEQTVFDGKLDVAVMTRKPMSIKTSFLDSDAAIDLRIKGTIKDPLVAGTISLSRGTLAFPYKPLHIMHGKLYFVPPHTFDPEITLVAKGRARHFDLSLRIGGSVQHPHISFESTPPLTEEQIITLLLIGSESGSFSLIMPTLIMNNMQHILFGPEQSTSKLETYFKSLLAPLKNIRIVPSFTDQSGRGGLRGAIEIDVNDQLHGLIQKNFSQLEDTKFEVEYLLSDDLTVRGIKDEHNDLGGEVEMRWKF